MSEVPQAVLDREAAIMVLDEHGVPTGMVDTSSLTADGAWLVPGVEGVTHPLASTRSGAGLAALLEVFDTDTLPDEQLLDFVAACERQKSRLDVRAAAAMVELTKRCARLRGVGSRSDQVAPEVMAAAELGPALRVSPVSAGMRVALAQALDAHPLTRAALEAGRIDTAKARALLQGIAHLDPEKAALVEARVLGRAGTQTQAQMRACLRRAVIAADPAGAAKRHEKAKTERGVWREVVEDGMSRFEWIGTTEDVEATYAWLTAQAKSAQDADRAAGGPVRTLDQARSDVMADLARSGTRLTFDPARPAPSGPANGGRVDVVVNLSTLLGADDLPGEIPGVGPVTAEVARRIAADAVWRRLLTDPATGALVDMSSHSYSPPQAMRDAILTRDRTCRFLGCRMPAARCDLDHTLEWPCGPTCPANLMCLCRTHHRIKTLTDTTYRPDGHGGHVWTMPSGRSCTQPPEPMLDPPDAGPPDPDPVDTGPRDDPPF